MIGAIACLASVIGYAVLSDHVNQALQESEQQLDGNIGIGLFDMVCVNKYQFFIF